MAVSGLLMAFDVVLIILSGVLDFNTLFFLAAAAFLIGVICAMAWHFFWDA